MTRKVIAFDLDDTLAVSKSPISERMAELLKKLLEKYEVCIISGGKYELFQNQVIAKMNAPANLLSRMHLMPTTGTRYYRFSEAANEWELQYAEDLTEDEKARTHEALEVSAKEMGLWPENPHGEAIEDRGSQVTFSALGQLAPLEEKYKWSEDHLADKPVLRDKVAALIPDLEVRFAGTTSVDVTRKGIDKAYGMQKLMDANGFEKTDILFFGDKLQEGGNDYAVKTFGIDCIEVRGWEDTAYALEGIIGVS